MKKNGKKLLIAGIILIIAFAIWTGLIQCIDVKPEGQNGSNIGFATFNTWFHEFTGVHMAIYDMTDVLSIIPLLVCVIFGALGLVQLIKRRSLFKVDADIIVLGVYYVLVIGAFAFFEVCPVNYRPILIEGVMEASYPSSTTLLVLSVMPTLINQVNRRVVNVMAKNIINVITIVFTVFMVGGRLISGVHWITDIVGGILLSAGLFLVYKAVVKMVDK